jgi:hypothetical protein
MLLPALFLCTHLYPNAACVRKTARAGASECVEEKFSEVRCGQKNAGGFTGPRPLEPLSRWLNACSTAS